MEKPLMEITSSLAGLELAIISKSNRIILNLKKLSRKILSTERFLGLRAEGAAFQCHAYTAQH